MMIRLSCQNFERWNRNKLLNEWKPTHTPHHSYRSFLLWISKNGIVYFDFCCHKFFSFSMERKREFSNRIEVDTIYNCYHFLNLPTNFEREFKIRLSEMFVCKYKYSNDYLKIRWVCWAEGPIVKLFVMKLFFVDSVKRKVVIMPLQYVTKRAREAHLTRTISLFNCVRLKWKHLLKAEKTHRVSVQHRMLW